MGGKSRRSNRSHSVIDRIKRIHAAKIQQNRFCRSQTDINEKQDLSRAFQTGQQFVFTEARSFRIKQMNGTVRHTR